MQTTPNGATKLKRRPAVLYYRKQHRFSGSSRCCWRSIEILAFKTQPDVLYVSMLNILSWPGQLCDELRRCAAEIEVLRLSFLPGGFGSLEL